MNETAKTQLLHYVTKGHDGVDQYGHSATYKMDVLIIINQLLHPRAAWTAVWVVTALSDTQAKIYVLN